MVDPIDTYVMMFGGFFAVAVVVGLGLFYLFTDTKGDDERPR